MKKLLTMAAVLALSAGSAFAQGASQNIEISAEVPTSCTVDFEGSDTALVPVTDGDVVTDAIEKVYPVVCNSAAEASLSSLNDGLSGPAAASGFDNFINYEAEASGFVAVGPGTTDSGNNAPNASLGTGASGGASSDPVTVTITPQANGQPLVAGTYEDTLTLAINPI